MGNYFYYTNNYDGSHFEEVLQTLYLFFKLSSLCHKYLFCKSKVKVLLSKGKSLWTLKYGNINWDNWNESDYSFIVNAQLLRMYVAFDQKKRSVFLVFGIIMIWWISSFCCIWQIIMFNDLDFFVMISNYYGTFFPIFMMLY